MSALRVCVCVFPIKVARSIAKAHVLVSKYYSPLKRTRAPWKNNWLPDRARKIQYKTGTFCCIRQ